MLKTRLALRKTSELNRGLWDAAKTIYNNNGIRAFYRGYIPNSIGIIPYAGIDLAVYETLKILYCRKHKDITDPGSLVILACGTISSVCGQLASYPLALVRTRLQASSKAFFCVALVFNDFLLKSFDFFFNSCSSHRR